MARRTGRTSDASTLELMAEVAQRYYLDDETKIEIAAALGISRFQVARLLQTAKDEGVVQITINHPLVGDVALAQNLRNALGIDEVLLVKASADVQVERRRLGERASRFLLAHAHQGQRVGFSWGRTLLPIVEGLSAAPEMEFVQVSGMVGNDPLQSATGMLAALSSNTHLKTTALFVPLFTSTPEIASAVRREPSVSEVLERYDALDAAYLSVGSWDPPINQLVPRMSEEEIAELATHHPVAEVVGLFFNAEGDYIQTPLNDRRISISIDQLRNTNEVVAVAGEIGKARAIESIARSGVITALITTDEVALDILERNSPEGAPKA